MEKSDVKALFKSCSEISTVMIYNNISYYGELLRKITTGEIEDCTAIALEALVDVDELSKEDFYANIPIFNDWMKERNNSSLEKLLYIYFLFATYEFCETNLELMLNEIETFDMDNIKNLTFAESQIVIPAMLKISESSFLLSKNNANAYSKILNMLYVLVCQSGYDYTRDDEDVFINIGKAVNLLKSRDIGRYIEFKRSFDKKLVAIGKLLKTEQKKQKQELLEMIGMDVLSYEKLLFKIFTNPTSVKICKGFNGKAQNRNLCNLLVSLTYKEDEFTPEDKFVASKAVDAWSRKVKDMDYSKICSNDLDFVSQIDMSLVSSRKNTKELFTQIFRRAGACFTSLFSDHQVVFFIDKNSILFNLHKEIFEPEDKNDIIKKVLMSFEVSKDEWLIAHSYGITNYKNGCEFSNAIRFGVLNCFDFNSYLHADSYIEAYTESEYYADDDMMIRNFISYITKEEIVLENIIKLVKYVHGTPFNPIFSVLREMIYHNYLGYKDEQIDLLYPYMLKCMNAFKYNEYPLHIMEDLRQERFRKALNMTEKEAFETRKFIFENQLVANYKDYTSEFVSNEEIINMRRKELMENFLNVIEYHNSDSVKQRIEDVGYITGYNVSVERRNILSLLSPENRVFLNDEFKNLLKEDICFLFDYMWSDDFGENSKIAARAQEVIGFGKQKFIDSCFAYWEKHND